MNKYAKALKARNKRLAAEFVPYSGTINQEDRKDNDMHKYENYDVLKHERPDMSHDWQKQKRNEMGIGIYEDAPKEKAPTYTDEDLWYRDSSDHSAKKAAKVAAIRQHSMNCTKLASLFLGDNVPESVLEAQAVDFASLSPMAVRASLDRYAETEPEAETEEEPTKAGCDCNSSTTAAATAATAAADAATPAGKAVKEALDNQTAETVKKVDNATASAETAKDDDEVDAELASIFSGIMADDENSEDVAEAVEGGEEEDEIGLDPEQSEVSADISGNSEEGDASLDAASAALAASFDEEDESKGVVAKKEEEDESPVPAKTASRRGVQSIGGASLKIASATASREVDLSGLWKDVPADAIF